MILEKKDLVRAIERSCLVVRPHAHDEAHKDNLLLDEVYVSVIWGKIIEQAPARGENLPYCIVYGQSTTGRHIHSRWVYNPRSQLLTLHTVYDPSKTSWLWDDGYCKRRQLVFR